MIAIDMVITRPVTSSAALWARANAPCAMAEATGCSGEAGRRLLRICQCDAVRQSAMNAWTASGMATTCQPLAI